MYNTQCNEGKIFLSTEMSRIPDEEEKFNAIMSMLAKLQYSVLQS